MGVGAGLSPRSVSPACPLFCALFVWLARPAFFSAAFGGSWLWPLLGIIFLPFTTLMYVLLWSPGIGLTGWDWVWVIVAILVDIGGAMSSAYTNRERMPGYSTA